MSLVEHELLTLPEHLSSHPGLSGVRVTRSIVLCVCFMDHCLSFCTSSFVIVLSVLLQYGLWLPPFDIFKLFSNIAVSYRRKRLLNHIHDRSLSWVGTGTSIQKKRRCQTSLFGTNIFSHWNNAVMKVVFHIRVNCQSSQITRWPAL